MTNIFQALSELESQSVSAALCTIVRSQGSTPRHTNSKMLVYEDGSLIGTVGGGELESRVLAAAKQALIDGN
ncbi:MAG: XdhC family protein, partial [Anaerolineae bacterium]|nr:XdhC family protein [Anaerolineae bacterium]